MTCEHIPVPGGVAIVCDRSKRAKKCKACGSRDGSPKLCDFPKAGGGTCDAVCCSKCARHVGTDKDYCVKHEEPTMTDKKPTRIKPKPALELAGDLAAVMADTLVLGVGHRTVDSAALSTATAKLNDALCADRRAVVDWYRSNVKLLMGTLGIETGECKSCKAPIYLVTTKNGKPAPIDLDGLNHFGSCRHAASHRGG